MIRMIELFAGIGSQTQALTNAGIEHESVAISEIDKYALQAYEYLHGAVNNLGDISKASAISIIFVLFSSVAKISLIRSSNSSKSTNKFLLSFTKISFGEL